MQAGGALFPAAAAPKVMMTEIWPAIGTVAVTLFGVWRMLAHYETRNDAAHAELGRRIDAVRTDLSARIDALEGRFHTLEGRIDTLSSRIDRLFELIAGQRS
jgi:hypothetical protein